MTATAPPVPGFGGSGGDAMDLYSDARYGLGDDDFDFTPGNGAHNAGEDALSLGDAGMDGTDKGQTPSANTPMHDDGDYMKDEDAEDDFEIEDADVEVQGDDGPDPANSTPLAAEAKKSPVDEDYIDYSDEDGLPDDPSLNIPVNMTLDPLDRDFAITVAPDTHLPTNDENDNQQEYPGQEYRNHVDYHDEDQYQDPSGYDNKIEYHEGAEYRDKIDDQDEGGDQGDYVEDDGIKGQAQHGELAGEWEQPAGPEYEASAYPDAAGDNFEHEQGEFHGEENNDNDGYPFEEHGTELDHGTELEHEAGYEQRGQENDESVLLDALRNVTLIYDGTEWWLFKPVDSEGTEDWLLSDESLALQPLSNLFQACRPRLGDDVSVKTELGLRFHYHKSIDMDLFEDSISCAYCTLSDLIEPYLALHAQDGETNPESFYITLLFRPRFLSKVSELKDAVQNKIGFTGLSEAINSGQSIFNQVDTSVLKQEEGWDSNGEEAGDDQKAGGVSNAGSTTGHVNPQGVHNGEGEDEYVGYSEDDDEGNTAQTGYAMGDGPSSASSTVQGDDAAYRTVTAGQSANPLGPDMHEDDLYDDEGAQYDDNTEYDEQTPYNEHDHPEFHEVHDQGFDNGDSAAQNFQADDGYAYGNDSVAASDTQGEHYGANGEEFDDGAQDALDGPKDFVDNGVVGDSAAFAQGDDDEINYDEFDEDVLEPSPANQSSLVQSASAQSTGVNVSSSPQGQKRLIDEVDFGSDSVGDDKDAKKTKT